MYNYCILVYKSGHASPSAGEELAGILDCCKENLQRCDVDLLITLHLRNEGYLHLKNILILLLVSVGVHYWLEDVQ